MKSFEECYNYVKERLSDKRFYHSECVMNRAIEYAKIYNENVDYAKLAGIVHDIAKEIPKEERIELAKKYGVQLDKIEINNTGLIHAKLGAKIAEKDLGLNQEICDAISYHTTGKDDMTALQKIIYLADFSGEDRNFEEAKYIYEMSKKDLNEALLFCFKYSINERIGKEKAIHPDTVNAYNYLLKDKKD